MAYRGGLDPLRSVDDVGVTRPIESFTGSYRFLSNFYPSRVQWGPRFFPTVEHAYQAAKCVSWQDAETILGILTPGQAKRYGLSVSLRSDWGHVKLDVMRVLLARKFETIELAKQLLETGDAQLVEGNNWGDEFWGFNTLTGRGLNHLGNLLMAIRAALRCSL